MDRAALQQRAEALGYQVRTLPDGKGFDVRADTAGGGAMSDDEVLHLCEDREEVMAMDLESPTTLSGRIAVWLEDHTGYQFW